MTAYNIVLNPAFNSLEVYFEGKPGENVRAALKALKFRWNNKKMCWYGFADREALAKACEGEKIKKQPTAADTEAAAKQAEKENQKRLLAIYAEEIRAYYAKSPKMQDYCIKKAAYIVELTNGDIIELEKPTIETSFCFGHGLYGVSTEEEETAAYNMMRHAETSTDYFITENLKGINAQIETLKDSTLKVYTFLHYTGQDEASRLKDYSAARFCETPEYNPGFWANYRQLTEIGPEDRERIIKGLEAVKAQFVKRLNTYLKKYGLTKINAWTYLVD